MKLMAARPLADRAVTFELADTVGAEAAARVSAAHRAIAKLVEDGALPGALELSRAYCSITLHYDPLKARQAELIETVTEALAGAEPDIDAEGRRWILPCHYDGADLDDLSETLGMGRDSIIARHAETEFTVYAIGFLPGLPFMGDLPEGFSIPRRSSPRTKVPKGSVAIANGLTVIYPAESPGGWHIVGTCPVPLFDATRDAPALLSAGDQVRFEAVEADEAERLKTALMQGDLDVASFEDRS